MRSCSIEELKDGFILGTPARSTLVATRVTLAETGFLVQPLVRRQLELFDDLGRAGNGVERPQTTLIDYRHLSDLVIRGVLPHTHEELAKNWRSESGNLGKACRELAKRIYAQWQRLVAKADPDIRSVQHSVYVHSETHPRLLHEIELYRHRYLVSDISRYPAAALSVPIAFELAGLRDFNLSRQSAPPVGKFYFAAPEDRSTTPSAEVIEMLSDWQALYSPTGKSYRSLSRTLMHLPSGIPSKLLFYLAEIYLERPFEDRLELLTLLHAQSQLPDQSKTAEHIRPFMFATHDQIVAGMHEVGELLDQELNPRQTRDVGNFVNYVIDAPDLARDLPTSVRRAIRWHQQERWREAQCDLPDHDTLTQLPRIPLPSSLGIRFLRSVGDVISESVEMNHCIACYVERAVDGECFLFHVDYEDEQASVEVDSYGQVRQARGPHNTHNKACEYGSRVLRHWGKQLVNR